jgi:hypothetical protein
MIMFPLRRKPIKKRICCSNPIITEKLKYVTAPRNDGKVEFADHGDPTNINEDLMRRNTMARRLEKLADEHFAVRFLYYSCPDPSLINSFVALSRITPRSFPGKRLALPVLLEISVLQNPPLLTKHLPRLESRTVGSQRRHAFSIKFLDARAQEPSLN